LRLVVNVTEKAIARTVERTALESLLKVLSKRYAVAITSSLVVGTVPLVGQLLELGFAAWMVWDMIQVWDVLCSEAENLQSDPTKKDAAAENLSEEERQKKVRDCQSKRPYALICDPEHTLYAKDRGTVFWEDSLLNYLTNFDTTTLGTPYHSSRFNPEWCGGGLGEAWHVPVEGDSEQTIELCECCDHHGTPAFHIVGKHKSRGERR
jgi:hypothetical protein